MTARRRLLLTAPAALLVLITAVACDDGATDTEPAATDDPVCGLVDVALLEEVLGDDELEVDGPGASDADDESPEANMCTIRRPQSTQPTVRVALEDITGDVDGVVDDLRVDAEDSEATTCSPVDDETGSGVRCEYTQGVFAPGVTLDVVREERRVSVRIEGWTDSEEQQRAALAAQIASDADDNLTAYRGEDK